ncbi:MAG: hypothetical protein KAU17_01235 [Spirochaetales bacterium]|nr:hypothetical protein [Spirochaetales bacterium]
MIELANMEIIALYLHLKNHHENLDERLEKVSGRIEKLLWENLSIADFEDLENLYQKNVDVFIEKG